MIEKISSTKNGQIVYHFSNGVILSMIWSSGSYTENNSLLEGTNQKRHELIMQGKFYEAELLEWTSTTVEIYSMGDNPNGITEYLGKKYGDNPAGHVPVNDIPKILKRAMQE